MPRRARIGRVGRDAFALVRELGLKLPGTELATMYGAPALKVRGQMFACMASHSSAEPDTLVVRVPVSDRDELIEADPDTYYLTDHYVSYASVLVRLARIRRDALQDLLLAGWNFVTAARPPDRRRRRQRPA